jgi:hypothetical protein
MAKRVGTTELKLLRLMAGGPIERGPLNEVVLTKALNDGYAEPYAMTMVRLTEAGYARLEQLNDRGF